MRYVCIVFVLIFMANPNMGFCSGEGEQYQMMTVLVEEAQFNVYGHWLSGEICIELVGDEVYADDWRVHPIIGLDLSIAPTMRDPATTPLGKLIDRLSEVYRHQYPTNGWEAARIAAIESVRNDPLIASIEVFANSVKIVTTDGEEECISFPPIRTEEELKQQRVEEAQRVYARLVKSLQARHLVIFVSGILPKVDIFRAFHTEVVDEIERARRESTRITPENWEGTRINALTAEQVRNPLPASMKRR